MKVVYLVGVISVLAFFGCEKDDFLTPSSMEYRSLSNENERYKGILSDFTLENDTFKSKLINLPKSEEYK